MGRLFSVVPPPPSHGPYSHMRCADRMFMIFLWRRIARGHGSHFEYHTDQHRLSKFGKNLLIKVYHFLGLWVHVGLNSEYSDWYSIIFSPLIFTYNFNIFIFESVNPCPCPDPCLSKSLENWSKLLLGISRMGLNKDIMWFSSDLVTKNL